ncbi:TPA: hypothetical protein ACPSKY_000547 [Legionella bozemanae]
MIVAVFSLGNLFLDPGKDLEKVAEALENQESKKLLFMVYK